MTKYQWADGYHPPKGISADALGAAVEALSEPTPDALFEASKETAHVLHGYIWSEGDQAWATRARREECRRILGGLQAAYSVGPKEIVVVRAVEFLRQAEQPWVHIETILNDRSLHRAYMAEIERLQEQALNKLRTFMRLLEKDEG